MRCHVCVRSVVALLFILQTLVAANCLCAQEGEGFVRQWKSGKFTIMAELVSQSEDMAVIKDAKGKTFDVEKVKLSEEDRQYLAGVKIIAADKAQHDLVMPHMERYTESPMGVAEILDQVAKDHPGSVYAPMMVGLALASEKANYQAAKKYFSTAVRNVKKHQKVLGEGFHSRTLVSLENNLAICKLKLGKGDDASMHFAAGGAGEIPFALYHNATLFMEATNSRGTQIKFKRKSREAMVRVLAKKKPVSPGVEVPTMYLFSLEWDEPLNEAELSRLVSLKGSPLPKAEDKATLVSGSVFNSEEELKKRGYREYAAATGVLISPKYLLTNRHVVQSAENNLSYTFTRFLRDGSPELIGGKIVEWSVVREQNLALVELDREIEGVEPIGLRQRNLRQGEDLTVIGFPYSFGTGEHIEATSGKFLGADEETPFVFTSNMMQQGVGGGPVLDMYGNLVGLAFSKKDFYHYRHLGWLRDVRLRRAAYSSSSVAISNDAITEFMSAVMPEFEFGVEKGEEFDNRHILSKNVRGSVMLVKSWKARDDKAKAPQDMTDIAVEGRHRGDAGAALASIRKKRLFPDVWCMSCYGTGRWRCPNCGGVGKVQVRAKIETGTRDVHGNKMYRWGTKAVDCSNCTDPDTDCRHCHGGKLPFQ